MTQIYNTQDQFYCSQTPLQNMWWYADVLHAPKIHACMQIVCVHIKHENIHMFWLEPVLTHICITACRLPNLTQVPWRLISPSWVCLIFMNPKLLCSKQLAAWRRTPFARSARAWSVESCTWFVSVRNTTCWRWDNIWTTRYHNRTTYSSVYMRILHVCKRCQPIVPRHRGPEAHMRAFDYMYVQQLALFCQYTIHRVSVIQACTITRYTPVLDIKRLIAGGESVHVGISQRTTPHNESTL